MVRCAFWLRSVRRRGSWKGEKKLFQKAPHDRSRHRRNGRTEKEVIGVPCILFGRVACITTVAEIEKIDF